MKTWCLDPGHGGVIDNIYQTFPEKMYKHSLTEVFYEGAFNRLIRDKLINRCEAKGIHVIDLCPTELDVGLDERADIANIYYRQYPNLVGISLHSNAGGGTGFEVYTSVGETMSDKYAQILCEELDARFPEIIFRKDTVDGDWDKEAHFYILKNTKCPWILPECLFFDNYNDYLKLIDPEFQSQYVDVLVNFMLKAELVL
ncbi:N-acetylmuramoyl-L-alanine amidase [bacterium]|nr:N-acetylmuramoyl-L-alanine amidase [bacterium]